jgi:cholesterol transport system auxiliary component
MHSIIRNSLVVVCGIAISSCSMFSPVAGPTTTYRVDAIPTSSVKREPRHETIWVALPEAGAIYSSTEMAYTKQEYQVGYFVKNSWVETPAQMLQPLIVQTLQNTHAFHAINSSQAMGSYDYVLNTQILKFEQDFTQSQSVFRLTLRVQLVRAIGNHVIRTKEITVVEPAPQNTPYGGVIAANRAAASALVAIRHFCLGGM